MTSAPGTLPQKKTPSILGLLAPYRVSIGALVLLTLATSALNLALPKLISHTIDSYARHTLSLSTALLAFFLVSSGVFVFAYLQSIIQTFASERVARDLRNRLAAKISVQEYQAIERLTPAKLLTNLTSDVDAIKTFVSQAIASVISSVFLIGGASVLLLLINWKLALAVLAVLPLMGVAFAVIFGQVRKLFRKSQEAIDWLNKVIGESILGAALIRIVHSEQFEYQKFIEANGAARDLGLRIIRQFATLIPIITFSTNIATLIILTYGGHLIIDGSMSLGDFAAFNSYLAILIFPILTLGFISIMIAQATASYSRILDILEAPEAKASGEEIATVTGNIAVTHVSVRYGEHPVLKDVSFTITPGTRTAIIGPTAAGKSQLLYVMTGLLEPSEGQVVYDGKSMASYDKRSLYSRIGFVFQDSSMFNLTLRENIAFSNDVTDESLQKAIATAELQDFVAALPNGLDTLVSERGTSLSGGQKQRIMLARALALDPTILLLDDFTARVDTKTERAILANVRKNYPHITLISVTQKIAAVEEYDQIIVLMEGEVLAIGRHEELLQRSPEYVQIYESQESTENLETTTV